MFWIFCFLLAGIGIWRGILPLHIPRPVKITLSFFTVLLAFNFILRRLAGAENMPVGVQLSIACGFSLLALYDGLLLTYDLGYYSAKYGYLLCKKSLPGFLKNDVLRKWLLLPAVLIVGIGMQNALSMPEVHEYKIALKNFPAELDGMRVVVLADVHADNITDGRRVAEIVKTANDLQPDLTVVIGDVVDRRVNVLNRDLQILGDLRARYGVFGVPGNHEYYSGYGQWMSFFKNIGINMLENRSVLIADERIALGGVTDPAAEKFDLEMPDVSKTFSGVPDGKFKLLLAHQPKIAENAVLENVDLQLSGHTHGGMIRGMDILIAGFNLGMVSGKYDYQGMNVFISNGCGIWSGFPVRLGRDSEIVLLRLYREIR